MIQRIQSVWLLVATVLALFSLKQTFFFGSVLGQPATPFMGTTNTPIMLMTILVGVFSFLLIFLYKKRRQQLWLTVLNLVLSLGLIAFYFVQINQQLGQIALGSIFVFAVPIFLLLAMKGIYSDRKLLKSVDRLRD
ncbi:DUF4293 domain-containing protein [Rhizosphaericola mali]|uniref:DUF4293 family protein n=1 Tax=Rhizosphaericola mali TaxID=2545455 RepID=A0A5P2FYP0_9BACT|nr:DUF4293 domain-containing protein [Rhizosphaericola mali]QES87498.1 DUF4293 family protein [Rhizosphaericola mali]